MGFKSQFKSQFKNQFKGQFSGGGIPNPAGSKYNYPFGARQDLIDNVSGFVSALVTPFPAPFVSGGLDLSSSYFATAPTSDAYYDSPEESTVAFVVGDNTNANITNGIGNEGGPNSRFISMTGANPSKYAGLLAAGAILTSKTNGVVIECDLISSNNWRFKLPVLVNDTGLSDYDAVIQGFENDGTNSNKAIVDWSLSGNDLATQKTLRLASGDTNIWNDITATDKVTIPGVALDAATANQVLLQSGDTGVFYDGTNLVADVNGATDSLPIAYDAIESAGYVYDGANIKVILNGVEGAGTASAAPSLGAYFSIGSNISNINAAKGVYEQLLVEAP